MKFELTQHAKDVLEEREIPLAWVKRVLSSPERIESDNEDTELEHYLGRIPEHGNRVLRVIINCKSRPVRIVTVYFDRTMRRKL